MDKEQAISVAKKEFEKHGHAAAEYDVTVMDAEPSRDHWMIWFDYRSEFPIPGGKHGVRVEKATGKAVYLPGE